MTNLPKNTLKNTELGQKSSYDCTYNPERLYAISRLEKRLEIGIDSTNLPFYGFDCWNHYEVSWLNMKGKPEVAIAQIIYDCNSPNIIESKSLKLYFNSFNHTKIANIKELEKIITKDLETKILSHVKVVILPLESLKSLDYSKIFLGFAGSCIDNLDIECSEYIVNPNILSVEDIFVEEILYSNLLKSNCLVTNQPDWGSLEISYKGKKINQESLLRYIVSFRNHNEFHEHCVERIFIDLMQYCNPQELTIYARYTRRGGLDINPYRSTNKHYDIQKLNFRLIRQ